jgi:hypothetical protein
MSAEVIAFRVPGSPDPGSPSRFPHKPPANKPPNRKSAPKLPSTAPEPDKTRLLWLLDQLGESVGLRFKSLPGTRDKTRAGPFVGPDAEVRHQCGVIEKIRRDAMTRGCLDYSDACLRIEAAAKVVAPIRCTTLEGMRAKAVALYPLARDGMSGYACRILAASLAQDVLGETTLPAS